ncbi:hypothetical protein TNCV_794541 [Trichonephila clavipes]|nr:hypothetical protein TNCV_794541 [Trichonephila clavipes]
MKGQAFVWLIGIDFGKVEMTLLSPTEGNSLAWCLNPPRVVISLGEGRKILHCGSKSVKLGGRQTCLSINRLWHELCDMLARGDDLWKFAGPHDYSLMDNIMIVQFRNDKS